MTRRCLMLFTRWSVLFSQRRAPVDSVQLTLPIGASVSDGGEPVDDENAVTCRLYAGDNIVLGRGTHAGLGASDAKYDIGLQQLLWQRRCFADA